MKLSTWSRMFFSKFQSMQWHKTFSYPFKLVVLMAIFFSSSWNKLQKRQKFTNLRRWMNKKICWFSIFDQKLCFKVALRFEEVALRLKEVIIINCVGSKSTIRICNGMKDEHSFHPFKRRKQTRIRKRETQTTLEQKQIRCN